MAKWIIIWDAGYGDSADVVEADTYEEALEMAHDQWFEDAQSNADYSAYEYTQDRAEAYGVEE